MRSAKSDDKLPLVSIIVPTMNSALTLRATLRSIRGQTYTKTEVIVVDSFSTDGTAKIASEFGNVRLCLGGGERSAQMNLGVSQAKGEYVYRVDSDFILEPTVVEEAVRKCLEGANAVLIHNTSDPTISMWSRARKLERDCYRNEDINVAIRFMRKSDFQAAGGFLENLVAAEDYDLHNRLVRMGITIARIEPQEVHIGEPRHLRDIVLKHIYYGRHIPAFLTTNPKTGWRQISPFRAAYIRHWRDFLKDPATTLAFFVYQYVRYASAAIGYFMVTGRGTQRSEKTAESRTAGGTRSLNQRIRSA